jgi:hypothetical protein
MKNNIHILIVLALLSSSCSKQKPEQIAVEFYNALITNKIDNAKLHCLPSAKEEIDRLTNLNVWELSINKQPIELLETVIHNPNFNEGDSAIVNYKNKHVRSFLTLIFKDKKWHIAYSKELKYIPLLEFESSDFYDNVYNESSIFWENYKSMYFKINNLIPKPSSLRNNPLVCIPYNLETNTLYVNSKRKNNNYDDFQYKVFGKEVNLNNNLQPIESRIGWENFIEVDFILNDIGASEKANATLMDVSSKEIERFKYTINYYRYKEYSHNGLCIINIIGRFSGYGFEGADAYRGRHYPYVNFRECKITDIKTE